MDEHHEERSTNPEQRLAQLLAAARSIDPTEDAIVDAAAFDTWNNWGNWNNQI